LNISKFTIYWLCFFLVLNLTTTDIQWLLSAYPVGTSSAGNSQLSSHDGKNPFPKSVYSLQMQDERQSYETWCSYLRRRFDRHNSYLRQQFDYYS